ncbi:MAG: alpha/beta fold hydrolase, partial [Pseudohongiellaceae bacterium]
MRTAHKIGLASVALIMALLVFWFRPGQLEDRFYSSSSPAYVPMPADEFNDYVQENRSRVRAALAEFYYSRETWPFGTAYPLESVVNMRSPYELQPDPVVCAETDRHSGFLMVHGLSDSPYLLRPVAESLAAQYPCALIRGLLTPGHATIPGDLKKADRAVWLETLVWAVNGFAAEVDQLYMVGYSNGAALALQYLDQHREQDFVEALILLSPGLEVRDPLIHLAPYFGLVRPWISRHGDQDAVKYESFPTKAAAQFYRLTQQITSEDFRSLLIPTLMVISGNDTTVNASTSLAFFCDRIAGRRHALWYGSAAANSLPPQNCAGLEVVDISGQDPRFVSHSHVAVTMPRSDSHYGENGNYVNCLAYLAGSDERRRCQSEPDDTVY